MIGLVEKPKPSDAIYDHRYRGTGVLDDCLYVVCHIPMKSVDVWVMKEYGVGKSWGRLARIVDLYINRVHHPRGGIFPLSITPGGNVLLLACHGSLHVFDARYLPVSSDFTPDGLDFPGMYAHVTLY